MENDNDIDTSIITARVDQIIRDGDLHTLSFKDVLSQLKHEFDADRIGAMRKQIKAQVHAIVESIQRADDDDDNDDATVAAAVDAERGTVSLPSSPVASRKRKPNRRSSGSVSGITKPVGISRQLASFLNIEYHGDAEIGGAQLARTEATRRIVQYVKERNLQSESDRRQILFDEPLQKLFGTTSSTFFSLQKLLTTHFEKSATKPKPKGSGGVSGFHRPVEWSEPLKELLGPSEPMSRPQTVKKIWEYIKAHDLQDPSDKRFIICDDKLQAVFQTDKVHMMKMNKILSQHLGSPHDNTTNDDDDDDDDDVDSDQQKLKRLKVKSEPDESDIDQSKLKSSDRATDNASDSEASSAAHVNKHVDQVEDLAGTRSWYRKSS